MGCKCLDLFNLDSDLTKELNMIATEYRYQYTELIDSIARKYGKNEFWWYTPIASRSEFSSSGYYWYCLILLVMRQIEKMDIEELIVPRAIAKCLKQNIQGRRIKIIIREEKKELIKGVFYTLYAKRMLAVIKNRISLISDNATITYDLCSLESRIYVDTYIVPSEFKDIQFRDRYFNGLKENADEKILFISQADFDSERDAKELAINASKLTDNVMFETLVSEDDYEIVNRYFDYCKEFKIENVKIGGIDYSSLIQHCIKYEGVNITSAYGILKNQAYKRLIEKSKYKPKAIIGWNEGQPSSIGLFYSLRNQYSDIQTISYILTPCYENNLSVFPSEYQIEIGAPFSKYAIQGEYWEDSVCQFASKTDCILAPSFRYNSVFDTEISYYGKCNNDSTIAVVLSYKLDSSEQMLHDFLKSIKGKRNYKIIIKNHPFREGFLLKDYNISPEEYGGLNIEYGSGNLLDTIKKSKIAVLCETTSCLEVILAGVFTIIYSCNGAFNSTCLPEKFPMKKNIAYDAEDITKLIADGEEYRPNVIVLNDIRSKCFTVVNKQNVECFLSQCQKM